MKAAFRLFGLILLAGFSLQLFFVVRIAAMTVINPESTSFERSQVWQMARAGNVDSRLWQQQWVPYTRISDNLKSAVIASEDASFVEHDGVDIEALEKAWDKNARAGQRSRFSLGNLLREKPKAALSPGSKVRPPKIVGGSTITQQLAKNLFLSGERTLLRKGQELVLTLLLEALLGKERILEIYLNNVEWGEGVFGAEAAAQHYFRKSAARLGPYEAARLAVMLPRPRYFESRMNSAYLSSRAGTITARMADVVLP